MFTNKPKKGKSPTILTENSFTFETEFSNFFKQKLFVMTKLLNSIFDLSFTMIKIITDHDCLKVMGFIFHRNFLPREFLSKIENKIMP